MSILNLSRLCLAVFLVFSASTLAALPLRSFERAEMFATCSGRLSALATRQRAHADNEAATTAELSALFETLLEAVLPDALHEGVPANQPAQWRSQGWTEVAALLADMDYSFDAGLAARAQQAVQQRIATCRAVLL